MAVYSADSSLKGKLRRRYARLVHRKPAGAPPRAMVTFGFAVGFDRAVSFANRPGNNPFTLQGGEGVGALIAFQKALGLEMAKAGLKPDKQFLPHITLLYDGQVIPAQAIEPVRWTVSRLALVQSKLGQTQHIVLQAWDLVG